MYPIPLKLSSAQKNALTFRYFKLGLPENYNIFQRLQIKKKNHLSIMVEISTEFSTEMSSRVLEVPEKEAFDYKRLDALLTEITADLSDVNPELFWKILLEFVKILNELSSALSLAFKGSYLSIYPFSSLFH